MERPLSPVIVGPEGYTVPLLKELLKSCVIYVRTLQEDIVLDINGPVTNEMSKTERLPMVQCTSCSKEIQLSVFENHRWQCAPTQRLSKITGDFPIVSEKSSFFTSLQEIFPDKPFLKFCWHTISTKINPRKSFVPKISKKLLLNLFRKRRILLLFLPDSSGQQHSFVLEWMCLTEFELCHF